MSSDRYWRTLDELRDPAGHRRRTAGEFPAAADRPPAGVPRRGFLQLAAASASLAAFARCTETPSAPVLPYARRPREVQPGLPLYYATSTILGGYATGVVVEAREGRPVKIEGNPDHPASLGAAGAFEQASILNLYDPSRASGIRRGDVPASWPRFRESFAAPADRGEQLCFLLEPTSSLLRIGLIERIRERLPAARFWFHAPLAHAAPLAAAQAVLGRRLVPRLDLLDARRVLAVGSDFLAAGPFHLRYARDFSRTHRPAGDMSRLYVAESMPSPTGSVADNHLRLRESDLPGLLAVLVAALGHDVPEVERHAERLGAEQVRWVRACAADLREHGPRSVVVVGPQLPVAAHALGLLANELLGASGRTVRYGEPAIHEDGEDSHQLHGLAHELRQGPVKTLVMLGGNPAYTAPADLGLPELLASESLTTIYAGEYRDRTAELADWFVATPHDLERWGDARAYDGTVSLVQPLIEPLFRTRTVDEVLAVFAGVGELGDRDLLRGHWRDRAGAASGEPAAAAERRWNAALQLGFLPDSRLPDVPATADAPRVDQLVREMPVERPPGLEVVFRADPSVYDGRFATNAWLLELPDPTTKLTWGNAVLLSPRTAAAHGVESERLVRLTLGERAVVGPALVVPGQADDVVTLSLGYGRTGIDDPGAGIGFDAYAIRSWRNPFVAHGGGLEPLPDEPDEGQRLSSTQDHWQMQGRPIVIGETLAHYRQHPDFTAHHRGPVPTLYTPPRAPAAEQWAMSIDLTLCTGCSACVIACQAENNIPVVGPEGVRNGREMHWLRIDRYLTGPPERPRVVHQPMMCQHCEMAPCEYVCPVNATVHSSDGLNEMVYNRCVGTRFCSNNCPYKVRRFNWFDYSARVGPVDGLVFNPEVTVRERGVMEKCTYCVQRIRRAQIEAEIEQRDLAGSEVRTACQQACPTEAIVFGSLVDEKGALAESRRDPRRYEVLHELGVKPRTLYLAKITHPHPALEDR